MAQQIKTGPTGSLGDEKVNMLKETTKQAAEDIAKAKQLSPEKGQVLYEKKGYHVFNCFASDGEPIVFIGGRFITSRKEDMETLDYFVKKGVLALVEDNR